MAKIAEVYLSTLSALMAPHGIERHFSAFVFLCENSGKVTQNDLAQRLKKDRVSTMRIVDYLSERDFVERKKDMSDRRCHLLEATEKAQRLLPRVKEAIHQTNEIILEYLSKKDADAFAKSMTAIMQKIESLPASEFIIQAIRRSKDEDEQQ